MQSQASQLKHPLAPLLFLFVSLKAFSGDLLDTYNIAVQNDHTFLSETERYYSERTAKRIAISGLLPTVEGVGAISEERESSEYNHGSKSRTTTAINRHSLYFTQPIFSLPAWLEYKQADQITLRAEVEYQISLSSLIFRVSQAYFEISRRSITYQTLLAEESAYRDQLSYVEKLVSSGLTSIIDVHEARTAYDLARIDALAAESNLEIARQTLDAMTGQQGISHSIGASTISSELINIEHGQDEAGLMKGLLSNNLKLLSQRMLVNAAQLNLRKIRSEHFPTVTAQLGYSDSNRDMEISSLDSTVSTNGTTASLNIRIPIYSGGRITASSEKAYHEHARAIEDEAKIKSEAIANARSLLRLINNDKVAARLAQATMVEAESGLNATQAAYKIGARGISDVIRSQRYYYQAKLEYYDRLHNVVINSFALKDICGTLSVNDILSADGLLSRDDEQVYSITRT